MQKNILSTNEIVKLKKLLVKMHFESGVGHLGGNLSAIDSMLIIFNEFLNDDDHFILSKGHSAGALYICLYSIGLINLDDLSNFHGNNTFLPGHPIPRLSLHTPFATGSLGHGLSIASGLAYANKLNTSAPHSKVYCFMSDGEWQEGSTWEAFLFFLKHQLNDLIVLIDVNGLQGFGKTSEISIVSDFEKIFSGFPVDVIKCSGHDPQDIRHALNKAFNNLSATLILLKTTKGFGVSNFEGLLDSHYLPISEDQFNLYINHQ